MPHSRFFPLSAQSATALQTMARDICEMLGTAGTVKLGAVADTLCAGRDLFDHRAAIWADDIEGLRSALVAIADGVSSAQNFEVRHYTTTDGADPGAQIRPAMLEGDAETAARAWLAAHKVDWDKLLPWPPQRMSLPTYPFEGQDIRPGQIGQTPKTDAFPLRPEPEVFAHHEIRGRPTYAGVALADLLFQAMPEAPALTSITWHRFLRDAGQKLLLHREPGGMLSVQAGETVLMSAQRGTDRPHSILESLRNGIMTDANRVVSASKIYDAAEALGTRYGAGFRRLSHLMLGDRQGWAMVSPTEHSGTLARAGLLDAGLQAAAALLVDAGRGKSAMYPAVIGQFWVARELPEACQVFFRVVDGSDLSCDILYCAPDGSVIAEIHNAQFATSSAAPVTAEGADDPDPLIAEYSWQEHSFPATDTADTAVVWCLDASETARARLASCLPKARFLCVSKARPCAGQGADLDLNDDPERLAARLDDLIARGLSPDLIVSWNDDTPEAVNAAGLETSLNCSFYPWLQLAGVLARRGIRPGKLLHLVDAAELSQRPIVSAMVSAFAAIEAEKQGPVGQVALVPPSVDPKALATVLGNTGLPGIYRYSQDRWHRLALCPVSAPTARQPADLHGVQVVTGGMGQAARALVEYLLDTTTTTQFLLIGRRDPDAAQQAWLDRNADRVAFAAADCAQHQDMAAAFGRARAQWGDIRGVFHIAGINRDRALADLSPLGVSQTLAPKLFGFATLDKLTTDDPLDHFTVFSSLAAEAPQMGQTCYAFANRALAHLALTRDAAMRAGERRGATRALMLPFLNGGGMQAHPAVLRSVADTTGVEPMDISDICPAVLQAMGRGAVVQAIMPGDRPRIEAYLRRDRGAPKPLSGSAGDAQAKTAPAQDLPRAELAADLLADLTLCASELLGLPRDQIEPEIEFAELGMDSVLLTQWATSLSDRFGFEVLPTVFFDGFTMKRLTEKLLSDHAGALNAHFAPTASIALQAPTPRTYGPAEHPQDAPAKATRRRIDLVGLACRVPGAETATDFWELLESGRIPIGIVPESRWPGGRDHAGLIRDVRRFDARFFAVSPMEAEQMDPQQRHLVEIAWQAFEDAGLPVASLKDVRTGVFVGASTHDYAELTVAANALGSHSSTGTGQAFLANRLSYMFDLKGPSQTIDTACSSSLVALTRAIDAMRSGRCDVALVAGVNLILTETLHRIFDDAGMLSPRGRCSTFDADADGYVRSEGVGAIILRARDVKSLGASNCYAEILGAAENHGGRAQSLTAPNPQAQADLICDAYQDAGIDVLDVDYVETHGTGTSLGDPVEVEGLKAALANSGLQADHPIRLGALKSQIGHLEAAAGIGALIKAALCLRHRRFPANCGFEKLNPLLRLDGTPFRVLDQAVDWEALSGRLRRVGVSSFGIGGSNAHVVLQEVTSGDRAPEDAAPYLFVLSAKSGTALERRQTDLARFLSLGPVSLRDLSFTLLSGREHFEHRRAFVADSPAALLAALKGAGLRQLDKGGAQGDLDWSHPEKVGRAYLAGLPVLPETNPQFQAARAISAPVYPFEGRDFWLPEAPSTVVADKTLTLAASDLILDQHRVEGTAILPGMASAAIALHLQGPRCAWGLRNLRWIHPIRVPEQGRIAVDLDERGSGTVLGPDDTVSMRFEAAAAAPERQDLPGAVTRFETASDLGDAPSLYARLADIGLQYGPAFQVVTSIRRHGDGFEAILTRPASWKSEPVWAADAVLLDGALHVAAAAHWDADQRDRRLAIPVGLSTICLWDHLPDEVLVRLNSGADDLVNLDIHSMQGAHLAALEGFRSQVIARPTAVEGDASLLNRTWVRTSLPTEFASRCDRVIVLDNDPMLGQLISDARAETAVRRIAVNGHAGSAEAMFDPIDEDALERVLAQWDAEGWYPDLVVHNLAREFDPSGTDDLEEALLIGVKTAFAAVRALSRLGRGRNCRFAYVYPEGDDDAVFAAASGLAHTVSAEQPSLHMTMISIADDDASLLRDSLLHTPHDIELRLKDNAIWASQLDFSE